MHPWLFLLCAILLEVIGTSSIKILLPLYPIIGYIFLLTMIGSSYFFLSQAIKRLPLGLAYALWEGIGLLLITSISVFFLGETLDFAKAAGILLIIAGGILAKYGTIPKQEVPKYRILQQPKWQPFHHRVS